MNRYRPPASASQSKASASTLCQKCLKRDDYECKASTQERPYAARPSRTQQLLNPKLVPKLTGDVPNDLLRRKGIADEQLALRERERKANGDEDLDPFQEQVLGKRRPRSPSSRSSSVSTISTNISATRSPRQASPHNDTAYIHSQRSPPPIPQHLSSARKRNRRSMSSSSSDSSVSSLGSRKARMLPRDDDRSTRRRQNLRSPPQRGRRRSRSHSKPRRAGERAENESFGHGRATRDRRLYPTSAEDTDMRDGDGSISPTRGNRSKVSGNDRGQPQRTMAPRERSLSPYSRRLALTQAMNTGR